MLTMSEHKGHEQHEIEDKSDTVDHIRKLPECILLHVLSFMPTKEVIKTSQVSTRWKNLWRSVPKIEFNDDLFMAKDDDGRLRPDLSSFAKFVERVLYSRNASNLEKFRLSCRDFQEVLRIHSWISYALMRNVQELDLSLSATDSCVIPWCLFHNTSLASLKIRMVDCGIHLPYHVSFPCLKTFHLASVRVLNYDCSKELFSCCPVLEELVLSDCKWINLKKISIASSTLKRLTIHSNESNDCKFRNLNGRKMKIDAENLTYFEYIGILPNKIILVNASSLVTSCIHIPSLNKLSNQATDLLYQLRYVMSLRLCDHTLKTLSFGDSSSVPRFPNLTHLMLTKEIGVNHTFKVLMRLLSSCPVLQSICFSEGFMSDMHLGENNSIWSDIPKCFSNSLKTVSLKNFHGNESEICFFKLVLKYACVLEGMDIWWSETFLRDLKTKTKVMKELESIEKSSTACVIKLS